MSNKRLVYLDYLRVLAAISVIVLHVSAKYFHSVDTHSLRWVAIVLYNSITRWGVPVFVMISGSLFLNREKSIKELYKKNILRIIIVFIIWSFIYAVFNYYTTDINLKKVIIQFIKGPNHLWYLKMIVLLYMMVPLLKKIIENKKLMYYFLLLTFIFSFVLPHLLRTITICFGDAYKLVDYFMKQMNLNFIMGFAFYFVLGYFLNNVKLSKKSTRILYLLGIIGFASTFVFTLILPEYTTKKVMFIENSTINVLLESILVFLLIKNIVSKYKINDKFNSFILKLSKYSFGQYLVHIIVLNLLDSYGFNSLSFNSFISIPIVSLVIIVISLFISMILNKIPILNKYLV